MKGVFDGNKSMGFTAADTMGAQIEAQCSLGPKSPSTDGFAWRAA
jgi:hypothetical protein